eukprot:CAMPEP_0171930070 /NCGR_PEP_ID=MMETSP0993-20121228/28212_1 /TAXON_ID=483369 /ORGANISM="non described non described, Strain CCMP2098" /LENGTH=71 /DNA_ID=CAMNT_0012569757 /DNA_START=661 /DNA_END=878 /DNA_ORIENTATION=+
MPAILGMKLFDKAEEAGQLGSDSASNFLPSADEKGMQEGGSGRMKKEGVVVIVAPQQTLQQTLEFDHLLDN